MTNFSQRSITSLAKKLSVLFNVKLKQPVLAGLPQSVVDDRKAFFDEQFKIIMKRIKESRA